jgi:16S rRNA processing protein RimM
VLQVGRIVRPHGLQGHVVVELWTNREERLASGSVLSIGLSTGARDLEVRHASRLGGSGGQPRWLVDFAGLATREDAEALRDVVLSAPSLEVDGAIWVHELVGSDLFEPAGRRVGRVDAVEANPASDLLILDDGRVVPLTFVSRDRSGRLTVDGPPGLLDPP